MAGNKGGLLAVIKRSAPEVVWTHCMIHHESLTMKELCPEVSEVMGTAIRTVNYPKTRPLESRVFAVLCEKMEVQDQSLLFYCHSRWLTRGNVVARVYSLRERVALFFRKGISSTC
jgi:hypothetical protein